MSAHKNVLNIAIPMVLSNLSVPLLTMVDTAVIGHLSEVYYLGAVSVAGSLFAFLFIIFNFLRMGTTGLVAQAYGRGDQADSRRLIVQALVLAGFIGLLLILVSPLFLSTVLLWMGAKDQIAYYATSYFEIRIYSAPFVLANYAVAGWLLGKGKAKLVLMLSLFANLINLLLDLLFVLGLGFTVDGVAWASLMAEASAFGLAIYWVQKDIGWSYFKTLDFTGFRRLLHLNSQLFIRTISLMLVFTFFTSRSTRFGDEVLAANTVLLNLQILLAFGLDGFAHAAETLLGQAKGSAKKHLILQSLKVTAIWSLGLALVYSLFYLLAGKLLIVLQTDIIVVQNIAESYIIWLIISPLISVWAFWLDGVFVGMAWGRDMRNTMFAASAAFFLAWFLLRPWGNHGLWLSFLLFFVFRGVLMGWRLKLNLSSL